MSKTFQVKQLRRFAPALPLLAVLGFVPLLIAQAIPFASFETEQSQLVGCLSTFNDMNASGGGALRFDNCQDDTESTAGAQLPITYNLSSLTGTIRYAAPDGSASASSCPVGTPCTLPRAISLSSTNDTVVMRGGTYRGLVNLSINRNGLRIIAYPGEVPTIIGSVTVPSSGAGGSGWNTDGSHRWREYRPRPVTDGSGIPFSSSNLNLSGDGVGRHPDQVWIGNTALREVLQKNQLQDGRFWVDRTNNRLYLTAVDAAKQGIEASRPSPQGSNNDRDRALYVTATNVKLEGIRITRFSNSANDYGAVTFEHSAHNPSMKHVEVSDAAYLTVFIGNVNNPTMEHVTLDRSNWMGFGANQTDNLLLKSVRITNMNPFGEFTSDPMSGAIKTARTKNTKILDSYVANNNSHGIWFDESNMNVVIANNIILDNASSGVFFEISDGLLLINNYIRSSGSREAFYAAGSSGVKLVNNTLIGGANPVAIYTDDRSQPNCSNSTYPISACGNGNTSVLVGNRLSEPNPNPPPEFLPRADGTGHSRSGFARQQTMDWMPRLDLMINNIVAYPTANRFCGITAMCITTSHSSSGASAPLQTILHQVNSPWSGIPRTQMDGNVYATNNANGWLIRASNTAYTSLSTFRNAMAAAPVSLNGIETNGLQGSQYVNPDGSPTAALASQHNNAVPVPQDNLINQYIPAGTRHYGVTYSINE